MSADVNVRKILMTSALLIILTATFEVPVSALDDAGSLRCDRESIMAGDTEFQVKTTCGEPDAVLTKGFASEVWIYDFGPTKFTYYLTFVNGRLTRIQVGEYGSYHQNRIID